MLYAFTIGRTEHSRESPGAAWLDDILVYAVLPEPDDYVPAPVPVDASPYILGMQVCSLWREGSHNGWDFIRDYPERKPYLGWYEEGNPEVSNWQIKWLAEHGVDFMLYCWYRPIGGDHAPIKRPTCDYDLHDGYFNAKYSHQVKFAILWEQGNHRCTGGLEDFRQNILPFWVEYYFKDPRYMTVGGRPVIGIYSIEHLILDLGGESGARTALELIRQACRELGFEDAILLCEYRETNEETMRLIRTIGFDAIYSYTWYQGDIQVQKEKMENQRAVGAIDVLPTLSMGWETEPWGKTSGNWADPDSFRQLAQWAKEQFMSSQPPEALGRSLVMLDNWNEYGEGHFMLPSGLHGFGYLDALREVFTPDPPHTDVVPTDRQKARLDTLYPHGWAPDIG